MYYTLLIAHSFVRWLVLAGLLFALYRAYKGLKRQAVFDRTDNLVRHWTATIAHIQLLIGILVYSQSPVIQYFWANRATAIHNRDAAFFAVIHLVLMLTAIVVITIGSALAKRKLTDREKFSTMLNWFLLGLIIIFIAIPWPFSPLANRPYLR
jgi:hypothetical protein